MTPHSPHIATVSIEALEARMAGRLASALTACSAALPHEVSERLRVARDQALSRARRSRLAAVSAAASAAGGTAVLRGGPGGDSGLPKWLSALMPLVLLIAGLMLIGQLNVLEQIQVAADIDTQLLSDDLPPAAYADPGFAQYLRKGPAP